MTKPRISVSRELFGIIGKVPDAGKLQAKWNRYFAEQGIDAFMDTYPTTLENLPERLSEMYHFDRRGYIVGQDLSEAIIPLLDDGTETTIDTVWNDGGVLKGSFVAGDDEKRKKLWIASS